jgi:uncharacterized protein
MKQFKNIAAPEVDVKDFTLPLELKDIDGKKGIVTGYFADFDSIDADGDIIKRGAFERTIKAMGPEAPKPRIKHLQNHNPYQPLGLLTALKEDKKGLYYESQIGTHTLGKDFLLMVEGGLITEHSIGYRTMKYNQLMPWEDWKEGEAVRELTELKLYEGSSLTAWGANPNTPLTGVKELGIKAKLIDDFCRDTKATDETIKELLTYNKQLLQYLQTTQGSPDPAENSGSPKESAKSLPDTCECPKCHKHTHNTHEQKGYVKCHRCSAVFAYGSSIYMIF